MSACRAGTGSTLLSALWTCFAWKKQCEEPGAVCSRNIIKKLGIWKLAVVPPVLAGLILLVYSVEIEPLYVTECIPMYGNIMQENAALSPPVTTVTTATTATLSNLERLCVLLSDVGGVAGFGWCAYSGVASGPAF